MPDASQHMTCMEVFGGNAAVDTNVSMAGLDAWVYARPYQQSNEGGDVYYMSSCATGRIVRLLIADVSGHGTSVGEIARSLRLLMRKYVNFIDQTRFVKSMNTQFVESSSDGIFATAIVATFFAPTCSISLCNAGHPPPLIYRARTKIWALLEMEPSDDQRTSNIPLGIIDLTDYEQFDLQLEPGDLVICYTDSLVESKDESGEFLGANGLLDLAQSINIDNPATIVPQLLEAIRARHTGNLEDDDVTVLLVRPTAAGPKTLGLKEKLRGPLVFLKELLGRDHVLALPDFRLANIGGALVPALNRFWRKGKRP